ncbi:basic salivary proline-rich protein 3 [Elephas maximus indicus]|uniref:basic salivary proline-rich protein 3 n=1 Tax=Elephas maximus indicus TaxID=99487 RepID=UPI0021170456|nr:basic salivary proline-rich protein 3 [Elephas maximus indicus]
MASGEVGALGAEPEGRRNWAGGRQCGPHAPRAPAVRVVRPPSARAQGNSVRLPPPRAPGGDAEGSLPRGGQTGREGLRGPGKPGARSHSRVGASCRRPPPCPRPVLRVRLPGAQGGGLTQAWGPPAPPESAPRPEGAPANPGHREPRKSALPTRCPTPRTLPPFLRYTDDHGGLIRGRRASHPLLPWPQSRSEQRAGPRDPDPDKHSSPSSLWLFLYQQPNLKEPRPSFLLGPHLGSQDPENRVPPRPAATLRISPPPPKLSVLIPERNDDAVFCLRKWPQVKGNADAE